MKKILTFVLVAAMVLTMFVGCAKEPVESNEPVVSNEPVESEEPAESEEPVRTADPNKQDITIGCTQQFANYIQYLPDMMAEWGYNVTIQVFDDVVTPNIALTEGSIDANFFQHKPYMDAYNASNGTDIYACEPYLLASYNSIASNKYDSIEEIPDGASIAIADDPSNMHFDLHTLEFLGLIELADIPEDSRYTLFDITSNPHNFEFVPMPMNQRYVSVDDVDAAVIFYVGAAAEKYGFEIIRVVDDDPDIMFPNIVAVNGKDKDAQWVSDMMDAFACQEFLDVMEEVNTPYKVWRILFEVEGAETEGEEETVRTADPNKQDIIIGGTQSFCDYLSFLPEKMGEWGYNVTFKVFDDVVTPDIALAEGSIDANFYQHAPYLKTYNEANGTNLVPCEPWIMASYESLVSKKYTSIDELPDGAKIAIADDSSNMSFDLHSLAHLGLIELAEIPEGSFYTTFDITANPHNFEFIPMPMMQRYTALDDVDAATMFYSARAAEKYEFNVLTIITDDPDIMFPIIVAIDGKNAEAQWVKDMMDAIAGDELRAVIDALNQPNLTWNILF